MNKLIISLMLAMLLVTTISASQSSLGTYKLGEDIELLQICGTCTYNNVTSIVFPNKTHMVIDGAMTARGAEYNYTLTDVSQLGEYTINGVGDLDGTANAWAYDLQVTLDGNSTGLSNTFIYIFIMLFFISLFVGFSYFSHKFDFEKWNNKIYCHYEDKNYVKLVLSSIGYNFMKNKFIIFYLLGLPVVMVVTEVTQSFNMASSYIVMQSILTIYLVGLLLVGLLFLSHVQEWFMDLLNKIRDMDWGIE